MFFLIHPTSNFPQVAKIKFHNILNQSQENYEKVCYLFFESMTLIKLFLLRPLLPSFLAPCFSPSPTLPLLSNGPEGIFPALIFSLFSPFSCRISSLYIVSFFPQLFKALNFELF
uniref:Uncharacterized protein n=1 Tax=Cacopsylla melanoneura TaxID=428564 RepID=A0A8D8W512_9HEMI